MKQILALVENELLNERQSLVNLVTSKFDSIRIPVGKEIIPVDCPKNATSGKAPIFAIIAGCLLFIVGIIVGKILIALIGALCLLAGWWLSKSKKSNSSQAVLPSSVNYSSESRRIFSEVKELHRNVSDKWESLLSRQCNQLRDSINSSGLGLELSSQINDILISRSVISFPMMDVLQELLAVGERGDSQGLKDYIASLKVRYISAIDSAYQDQSQKYYRIQGLL